MCVRDDRHRATITRWTCPIRSPVAVGKRAAALGWLVPLVNFGATLGLGTVVLVLLLGQIAHLLRHVARRHAAAALLARASHASARPMLGTMIIGGIARRCFRPSCRTTC